MSFAHIAYFFLNRQKREIYCELYCVTLTSSFWLRFSSGGGSWSTWLLRQHMSHRPHIIGSRLRRYKIQSKKILILLALPRRFCIISQLRQYFIIFQFILTLNRWRRWRFGAHHRCSFGVLRRHYNPIS